MLVNAAESEAVKNSVGTANKWKKVQNTIFPEEDLAVIETVARKLKKVRIYISKKKKQRKVLESENPYLLMRARKIIRNKEKLKQLEAKEQEFKLTKDNPGKY